MLAALSHPEEGLLAATESKCLFTQTALLPDKSGPPTVLSLSTVTSLQPSLIEKKKKKCSPLQFCLFFLSFMTTCPLSVLFKERVSTVLKNVNVVIKDYLSVKMVFSGLSPCPGFSKEVALHLIDTVSTQRLLPTFLFFVCV